MKETLPFPCGDNWLWHDIISLRRFSLDSFKSSISFWYWKLFLFSRPSLAVLTWRLSFSVLRRWMWSAAFISWAALLILICEFSERPGTIFWSLAKLEAEGALLAWSASTFWSFLLRLFLIFDVLACSTWTSSWGVALTITDCLIELGENKSTSFVLGTDLFSIIYWPPEKWKLEILSSSGSRSTSG